MKKTFCFVISDYKQSLIPGVPISADFKSFLMFLFCLLPTSINGLAETRLPLVLSETRLQLVLSKTSLPLVLYKTRLQTGPILKMSTTGPI